MSDVIVHRVKRTNGIAGQFSVVTDVQYPDEPIRSVEFISSVYGGPVVIRTGKVETFVTDPGRFGEFGEAWARRFFEES